MNLNRRVPNGLPGGVRGRKFYYFLLLDCVPGMAWVQLEINQPQVVTAKCSEPQAVDSDVMGEGSGVAILLSVRTETWLG